MVPKRRVESMKLVGKFVHVLLNDGEFYSTGEIVQSITETTYLVKFDVLGDNGPSANPTVLVDLAEMLQTSVESDKQWSFFNSRKELHNWFNWLQTPLSEHKVN